MGVEGGPNFGRMDGETLLERAERARLIAEIHTKAREAATRGSAEHIANNPELAALMGRLIETGPELDPPTRAHLRRIVALALRVFRDVADDADFGLLLANAELADIDAECAELDEFMTTTGLDQMSPNWEAAVDDFNLLWPEPSEE